MKKFILLSTVFLILLSSVYGLDKEKGYSFLNKTLAEGDWNFEIDTLSLGILALEEGNYDVSQGLDFLESKKEGGSWDNRIKDTALAILALHNAGRDVDEEVAWLKNAVIEARVSGDWLIQINAENGQCSISYQDEEKSFTLLDDKVVECSNDYWIDIKRCLSSSLGPYEEILVDCSPITGSPEISLLYREEDSYRIMPQQGGNVRTTLILESGCYGDREDSRSCDFQATAFATWVLSLIGEEDVYTNAYLLNSLEEKVDYYALVSLITLDDSYAVWLAERQDLAGSWDSDNQTA